MVTDILLEILALSRNPKALVLFDENKNQSQLSFSELQKKSLAIAAYLQNKKLAKERAILLYPTGLDFTPAFLGCLFAQVTAVPVPIPNLQDFSKSVDLLKTLIADSNPACILTMHDFLEPIKQYQLFSRKIDCINTALLNSSIESLYRPTKISSDTLAYLQYTSGSTSAPKAAMITHENLFYSIRNTANAWHYKTETITLNWAPHSHVYGLVCGLLLPLMTQSTAMIFPVANFIKRPLLWLELISDFKVTHSGGPNFGFDLCVKQIQQSIGHLNLSHWRAAINGGEKAEYSTLKKFSEKFAAQGFRFEHFCPAYGMSELSGAISSKPFKKPPRHCRLSVGDLDHQKVEVVSCGKPIKDLKAVIVDPVVLKLIPEERSIGEIWLSGKSLSKGYWQRAEETRQIFQATLQDSPQHYFRTGDLGFIEGGEIFITGRLKELIIQHGKKYNPSDFEILIKESLSDLPLAGTNAAFSVLENDNELPIFVQEIRGDVSSKQQIEIAKTIRELLVKKFAVDFFEIILVGENTIAKTSSGKVSRKACQAQYINRTLVYRYKSSKEKKQHSSSSDLFDIIVETLNLDRDSINLDDSVAKYGFDSITIIQLSEKINKLFTLNLTPAHLYEYKTLRQFIDDIQKKKNIKNSAMNLQSEVRQEFKAVAIIGISGIFPGAENYQQFWDNLVLQKNVITSVPTDRHREFNGTKYAGGFVRYIKAFDAEFFGISPREAELIDPQQRVFLETCWHAIEDAGYSITQLAKNKVGVFAASFTHDYAALLQEQKIDDPFINTGISASLLANRVSYFLNLTGPSLSVDTACSSSLTALHYACRSIQQGDCQMALAGGVNALLSPALFRSADKAGMLSAVGICKTFDSTADGYVRSEGAAVVLLKSLEQAIKDNDFIYGVIRGSAINHGGQMSGITVPNPKAQADVILNAYEEADIDLNQVSYIETHGTATRIGDPIEINALKMAFENFSKKNNKILKTHFCGLGALKTHIGHLEAAAGIAGLIKILLCFKHESIPGNLHFKQMNPYIQIENTPFYLINGTKNWLKDLSYKTKRYAGLSSFGFGGSNAHLVIEEYENRYQNAIESKKLWLFPFSAKHPNALRRRLKDFLSWLQFNKNYSLKDISYTLWTGREHFRERAILAAQNYEELEKQLEELLRERKARYTSYASSDIPVAQAVEAYLAGRVPEWNTMYPDELSRRIPLPGYPFEKTFYDIPYTEKDLNDGAAGSVLLNYVKESWQPVSYPIISSSVSTLFAKNSMLILFSNRDDLFQRLQKMLKEVRVLQIKSTEQEALSDLALEEIVNLYVWHFYSDLEFDASVSKVEQQLKISLESLYTLAKNLLIRKSKLKISVLYSYLASNYDSEPIYHSLHAFIKSIQLESDRIQWGIAGFAPNFDLMETGHLQRVLWNFLSETIKSWQHYYSDSQYWIKSCQVLQSFTSRNNFNFKNKNILITGGLGQLGLIFAKYLAAQGARLILTGRSNLQKEKEIELHYLQGLSEVEYFTCDITQKLQIEQLFEFIEKCGPVNGIIHAAGVANDQSLLVKSLENFSSVLKPKLMGAILLDQASAAQSLDFFIMFSSIAALWGNRGQTDYASANAFLDGFADYRENLRRQGLRKGKTLSIQWPLWERIGLNVDLHSFETLKANLQDRFSMPVLSETDGIQAFINLLNQEESVVSVLPGNLTKIEFHLKEIENKKIINSSQEAYKESTSVSEKIISAISQLLKLPEEKLNLNSNLSELGFDSISLRELSLKLSEIFNFEINPDVFYNFPSINSLTQYLENKTPAVLESPVKQESSSSINSVDKIAIVGMSGIFPQSQNLNEFWQHLINGDDLITEIPKSRWDFEHYPHSQSKWGGFIENFDHFDASFFNISPAEAGWMDPQHRLFLQVVWQALEDSGYDPHSLNGKRVGVFAGIGFAEYQDLIRKYATTSHAYAATGNTFSLLANRISYFFNFHGPSESIDTACSSSLVAVHRALQALKNQECELAIVGGVNLILDPETYVLTSMMGALSPDGRCKTLDAKANGYVKGEGVGAVVLKSLHQAKVDGNPIYATFEASAVNHGGKAQSITAPNTKAQRDLIIDAYQKANIDPATISYIELHGTGTELGDPVEVEALRQAFSTLPSSFNKQQKNYCGIGSVKTQVGHLEPAAGIISLIKVALALHYKKLPGILHFHQLNPYIQLTNSPFFVLEHTQPWLNQSVQGHTLPLRAGINSFGFGGTNAHVVLQEVFIDNKNISQSTYLFVLSAKSKESLQTKISDLVTWLKLNRKINLLNLSYTLATGRSHFDYRVAVVADQIEDLIYKLHNAVPVLTPEVKSNINPLCAEENLSLDNTNLLQLLAASYCQGSEISWNVLYKNIKCHKLPLLPPYPFDKKRFWFETHSLTKETRSPHTDNEIDAVLKKIFSDILKIPMNMIRDYETYENYGVDSFSGMEIIKALEIKFGSLPKTLLYEKKTLQELNDYLKNIAPKPVTTSLMNQTMSCSEDSIAVIGMSGVYPQAEDIREFWKQLLSGFDGIKEIPVERWDYKEYPVERAGKIKHYRWGGFISDVDKFDSLFFKIAPEEANLMDPQERLFLQTVWLAIEDAGYTRQALDQFRSVGVFVGSTYNYYPLIIADASSAEKTLPLNIQTNGIANRVSYFFNWHGPSLTIDTACSSSLTAIHLACESIRNGESQVAIAGGVNLSIHPAKYQMLGSYGFLSEEGKCASFGADGSGYVPGEGVGAILLKPLTQAIQDGDYIYGTIKASAINHGGKTSGYTVPNPEAQTSVILDALKKAKINPRMISYVEAHGTGTSLGDPIEVRGLQMAYEQYTKDKQFCALGSVKSNIGHLEGAAGISQITKVLLQFKNKYLVPSLHAEKLNPHINFSQTPFFVLHELTHWKINANEKRYAAISSFGAGGVNVHVILEENHFQVAKNLPVDLPLIFILSAVNQERLDEYRLRMLSFLIEERQAIDDSEIFIWLKRICYILQTGRESFASRMAVVFSDFNDLIEQLNAPTPREIPQNQVQVRQWLSGERIEWQKNYSQDKPTRISLPGYPFEKRTCWVGTKKIADLDLSDWCYSMVWQEKSLIQEDFARNRESWLIFSDHELGSVLLEELGKGACLYCLNGEHFTVINEHTYSLNPKTEGDYLKLFEHLRLNKIKINGIIYLWNLKEKIPSADQDIVTLYPEKIQLIERLFYLYQALIQQAEFHQVLFCLVTRSSQAVDQHDPINIWQHHLWSFTRIFTSEQTRFPVLLIDLDSKINLKSEAVSIKNEIIHYRVAENHIAYRNQQRYVPRLLKTPKSLEMHGWKTPQVALITGGLGALGGEVARALIAQGTRYLLLVGATELIEGSEKWELLNTLKATGAQCIYAAVDVTQKNLMEKLMLDTEREWRKKITGVFHLAGVTTDALLIDKMSLSELQTVIGVKVKGALVLHELFKNKMVQCFVLFSSISSLPYFGINGLSAYAAANEFLNGLAVYRAHQGLAAQSILWGSWADKGMSHKYNHNAFLEAVGMPVISVKDGLQLFTQILKLPQVVIGAFKIFWERFLSINKDLNQKSFFSEFVQKVTLVDDTNSLITHEDYDENAVEKKVAETLSNLLSLNAGDIKPQFAFQDYGMDSIHGINFTAQLNQYFADLLSPMDLYRYTTVSSLSRYIYESLFKNLNKGDVSDLEKLLEAELATLD